MPCSSRAAREGNDGPNRRAASERLPWADREQKD